MVVIVGMLKILAYLGAVMMHDGIGGDVSDEDRPGWMKVGRE